MLGTANLNHMRGEIKTVVGTVASMITEPSPASHYQDKSSDVFWTISVQNRSATIYCRNSEAEESIDTWGDHDRWLYHAPRGESIGSQDVVRVHQSLEGFLVWVMGLYPQLEEQLKPMFEASEL